MEIKIDGFFGEFCQGCPEIKLAKSCISDSETTYFLCENLELCEYLRKRLKEKMEEENGQTD